MISDEARLVYKIVSYVPRGKVLTYGAVAQLAGRLSPRRVGYLLHQNRDSAKVPCHRVVSSAGRLAKNFAFGGWAGQKRNLRREGVEIKSEKVRSGNFWRPTELFGAFVGLWRRYGEPGPWPWFGRRPAHSLEEIAIGAILTQNTNWHNVELALANLKGSGLCSLAGICQLGREDGERLRLLIRPSGCYNQKSERLLLFSQFIQGKHGGLTNFGRLPLTAARGALLEMVGIGEETADTILLYALRKPVFIIDNYTRRFLKSRGLKYDLNYEDLHKFFEANLPRRVDLYQDFHALMVRRGRDEGGKEDWSRRAESNG